MSDAQLQRKFRLLVDPILGGDRAAAIVETVGRVERLPSVHALTVLLAPGES
jgi:hypothetical protein